MTARMQSAALRNGTAAGRPARTAPRRPIYKVNSQRRRRHIMPRTNHRASTALLYIRPSILALSTFIIFTRVHNCRGVLTPHSTTPTPTSSPAASRGNRACRTKDVGVSVSWNAGFTLYGVRRHPLPPPHTLFGGDTRHGTDLAGNCAPRPAGGRTGGGNVAECRRLISPTRK